MAHHTYWWIAVSIDWASTIVMHDCSVEENPFMRNIWCKYGDLGFSVVSISFGFFLTIAIWIGWRYGYVWSVVLTALPIITFKILIALTNLALIPYWVTGWWQY